MASLKKTKQSSIVSRIAPVHELPKFTSMLIYGKSGTGKTAFLGTFPKPLLLLEVKEKGTDTIANVEGVDVISINQWSDVEEVYWHLKGDKTKYKSIGIDQITGLQAIVMEHVKARKGKDAADLVTRQEWGEIAGTMNTWLMNYRDLVEQKLHVCFIAHERTNESEETVDGAIDPSIGPRLSPSVASLVNGAVSVIGNTFIREKFKKVQREKVRTVQYCMRVGPHAYYTTKIRRPKEITPPDVLTNPTFEKLMAVTRGEDIKKAIKSNKR